MLTVKSLGFDSEVEEQFRELVNKPYGVVLVTGPTGSGKSTTLYAVLQEVASYVQRCERDRARVLEGRRDMQSLLQRRLLR